MPLTAGLGFVQQPAIMLALTHNHSAGNALQAGATGDVDEVVNPGPQGRGGQGKQ